MKEGELRKIVYFTIFLTLLFLIFLLIYLLSPIRELKGEEENSIRIYDRNGILLYETLGINDKRKLYISKDVVPPHIETAVIATEDKRFYKHCGIDPFAIGRAMMVNLKTFSLKEGGSTITQQTAKLLVGRRNKNLFLKFYETLLAIKLEIKLSKKEILSLYLNLVPYGKNIVGIKKASEVYFNASPENLSLSQIAYLCSIPKSPTFYLKNPQKLLQRRDKILKRMRNLKFISEEELKFALEERITLAKNIEPYKSPHFVEKIKEECKNAKDGAIITTIDNNLNETILEIIKSKSDVLKKIGAKNVAVIVIDNQSNEIVGYEGSGNFFDDESGGKIDGVMVKRQPGSALKPFLYALAFDDGLKINSVLPDIPSSFKTSKAGALYSPRNYDGKFRGPLSVRLALANSVNVPAVYLLDKVGANNFLDLLRRGGVTTLDNSSDYYGLGLALGNGEVRLDELSVLYSSLSRGGVYIKPTKILNEISPKEIRLFSYDSAFLVTDILSDNKAREIAFGRGNYLEFPYNVASKTGTSEGYHDNFALGYTRAITVGVWVGNFDRKPLKYSSGISGAGPIYHYVMEESLKQISGREPYSFEEILEKPSDLKKVGLCLLSQMKAKKECPSKVKEYAKGEVNECDWHIKLNGTLYTNFPENYRVWANNEGLLKGIPFNSPLLSGEGRERFPQLLSGEGFKKLDKEFKIVSPLDDTVYLIDPSIPPKYQGIYLQAENGVGKIRWVVDGKTYDESEEFKKVFLPLQKGEHTIEAIDSRGKIAKSKFTAR
jgi:penicillin-binding protein 1C